MFWCSLIVPVWEKNWASGENQNKNENNFVKKQVFAVVFGVVHILEEAQFEPIKSHLGLLLEELCLSELPASLNTWFIIQWHNIHMIWEYMHIMPIYIICRMENSLNKNV